MSAAPTADCRVWCGPRSVRKAVGWWSCCAMLAKFGPGPRLPISFQNFRCFSPGYPQSPSVTASISVSTGRRFAFMLWNVSLNAANLHLIRVSLLQWMLKPLCCFALERPAPESSMMATATSAPAPRGSGREVLMRRHLSPSGGLPSAFRRFRPVRFSVRTK